MRNFYLCTILLFVLRIRQGRGQIRSDQKIIYLQFDNYTQYSQRFQQNVGKDHTVQVTQYGTGKQRCYGKPCRFYTYIFQPQEQTNSTILFVSGLHGNEKIGPTSLLYAYNLLKNISKRRIIFFPIGNPSGYILNTRLSSPQSYDPNRDYPIDRNEDCYKLSATRIIDHIFRINTIDLTINLHNGGSEIGWNWGTILRKKRSHAADYDISLDIGTMLKFYGGKNKMFNIKEFKIGTMTQSIYPANGTLDDWAYAASWDDSVPQKCKTYSFQPYPINMNNCLMFLIQLGQFSPPAGKLGTSQGLNIDPQSQHSSNGYISRALRMFQQLIYVMDPQLSLLYSQKDNKIFLKLVGCNTVQFTFFEYQYTQKNENGKTKKQKSVPKMFKTEEKSFTHFAELPIQFEEQIKPSKVFVSYKFTCDPNWKEMGKTMFAEERKYIKLRQQIIISTDEGEFLLQDEGFSILWLLPFLTVIIFIGLYFWKVKSKKELQQYDEAAHSNFEQQQSPKLDEKKLQSSDYLVK